MSSIQTLYLHHIYSALLSDLLTFVMNFIVLYVSSGWEVLTRHSKRMFLYAYIMHYTYH